MKPTKPETSSASKKGGQGGTVCCTMCGYSWVSKDWKQIEASARANGQGWYCLSCAYLEMTRRVAHSRKMSLKQIVRTFLEAVAEWEHITPEEVWKASYTEKASAIPPIPNTTKHHE